MSSRNIRRREENLELRLRRAKSWLARAQKESDDPDAAFIFLWIAFNAAYGKEETQRPDTKERDLFDSYFETILSVDSDNKVNRTIVQNFSGPVRILLANEFVYWRFWRNVFLGGYDNWRETLKHDEEQGLKSLTQGNTREVLNIIFDRLYVARNQIVHGGATWQVGRNRDQVRDGERILASLVPMFVDLMENNPQVDWGPPDYWYEGKTGSIL